MNRLFVLFLAGLSAVARADNLPGSEFQWRQAVQGETVSGRLYRVQIGDAIYDRCNTFPSDIRVMDGGGRAWPFFLWTPTGAVETLTLKPVQAPPAAEPKPGVQTLWFDAGIRHRPLKTLRLVVAAANFALPVKVFGRNVETNTWRWVADGGVHRMPEQTRDTIVLHGCAYRWLRVELYHYEEPAPSVTEATAEAVPNYLVFEARGDGRPFIYFGSPKFSLPHYDLQMRTPASAVTKAPTLELGRRQRSPQHLAVGLGRYGRWLVIAAAVVVGGLVVMVALNVVRRRAPA